MVIKVLLKNKISGPNGLANELFQKDLYQSLSGTSRKLRNRNTPKLQHANIKCKTPKKRELQANGFMNIRMQRPSTKY